jgi:hypothetical protein
MKYPTSHCGRNFWFRATLATLVLSIDVITRAADSAPLRAGMIGLDTSHVPAFARSSTTRMRRATSPESKWWPDIRVARIFRRAATASTLGAQSFFSVSDFLAGTGSTVSQS